MDDQTQRFAVFSGGDVEVSFLPGGDIREITGKHVLINQFVGERLDGSANNIWLKLLDSGEAFPLLGAKSGCRFFVGEDGAVCRGEVRGIRYEAAFACAENTWFWRVTLHGHGERVRLVCGQDVGLGSRGGVRTNELYISQYVDHFIDEGENGYTVCSRQNMNQGGTFPALQQGCLDRKTEGFCTDGTQFFGNAVRAGGEPAALLCAEPLREKHQFEMAYIGLWTEVFSAGENAVTTFYASFTPNRSAAFDKAEPLERIRVLCEAVKWEAPAEKPFDAPSKRSDLGSPLASPEFTQEELDRFFPQRTLEEREDGALLSFFTPEGVHAALRRKELASERPHGHIITTLPERDKVSKNLLTSSNYMYGVFNAQTAIGNTDSNRLLSANRGLLNLQKYTGQRVWAESEGKLRVLTVPAVYELGFHYARWYYKLPDDILVITVSASAHTPELTLRGESLAGKRTRFLVTQQLSMGGAEFDLPVVWEQSGSTVTVRAGEGNPSRGVYPELAYRLTFPEDARIGDDRLLFEENAPLGNETLLCAEFTASSFEVRIAGTLDGTWPESTARSVSEEESEYRTFYGELLCGLRLEAPENASPELRRDVEKLNVLAYWYIHNALVHFYTPRGLEQVSGAAWGTRDVCQGPMELLLTFGHYQLARAALLEVFAHQRRDDGEWPQWFMFDLYPYAAGDCHGDVVFWPLKCLGDYIETSGDRSVLEERLPWLAGGEPETVLCHAERAFEAIRGRFVGDTHLISYAGGDWDDTLQPADPGMKEKLVSAWTQALAYQTLTGLGNALAGTELGKELLETAEAVREDFNRYLIRDGVIAGFVRAEADGSFSVMLHPSDTETGIRYRLLPQTRSIISGLVGPEQAVRNLRVIDDALSFPDGVRLMDRPAGYEGGVSRLFQRAEQAACVGREISLQYVHAHIRYLEAMAVLGESGRLWGNLMKIVPIGIREKVPNAALRQSNCYFSSSEGDFRDRYEYARDFDKLRTGEIDVRGGWRIYSSGPGIFLGRLAGGMLGVRPRRGGVELDPVLPRELDGLRCHITLNGVETLLRFHVENGAGGVRKIECGMEPVPFEKLPNPYRNGGAELPPETLSDILQQSCEASQRTCEINIYQY